MTIWMWLQKTGQVIHWNKYNGSLPYNEFYSGCLLWEWNLRCTDANDETFLESPLFAPTYSLKQQEQRHRVSYPLAEILIYTQWRIIEFSECAAARYILVEYGRARNWKAKQHLCAGSGKGFSIPGKSRGGYHSGDTLYNVWRMLFAKPLQRFTKKQ